MVGFKKWVEACNKQLFLNFGKTNFNHEKNNNNFKFDHGSRHNGRIMQGQSIKKNSC